MDIIEDKYTSVADTYVLPFTGESKNEDEIGAYFFWKKYSIEDYHLIVVFNENEENLCGKALPNNCYVTECFDINGKTILIIDISQWSEDVDLCLKGEYSKLSLKAKASIEKFHRYEINKMDIKIYSTLYPNKILALLGNKTPIEYVSKEYGLDLQSLQKKGELGVLYNKEAESLILSIEDLL